MESNKVQSPDWFYLHPPILLGQISSIHINKENCVMNIHVSIFQLNYDQFMLILFPSHPQSLPCPLPSDSFEANPRHPVISSVDTLVYVSKRQGPFF